MPGLRPLPRSLTPFRDESLAGFVLRLAHHNTASPGTIVRHTGLSAHRTVILEHISIRQQYQQLPEQIAEFARTTRLSRDEVSELFMAPLGPRYGPLNEALTGRPADRMLYNNRGIFRHWSRFCPLCLAGDSDIERAHGGNWKRLWRLPPVFTCATHRCMLRHDCTQCGHHGLEVQGTSLIPRIHDEDLHPNQCRTVTDDSPGQRNAPACGARHDQAPPPTCSDKFLDGALVLQQELLGLLVPSGPEETTSVGWIIDTAQYFFDLHSVAGLILLTWPATRPLAPSDEHADILDRDVARRQRERARLQKGGKHHYSHVLIDPASDSTAYAASAAIAHQILQATDRQALRLLAPVQTRLRELPGPDRSIGDTVRNSPRNSPPLRVVLARKEPVTQKAILGYRDARHREWRPAAANNDWVRRVTDTSAK